MCSTKDPPELLVAQEVAEILRVKVSTVYAAAKAGRIPAVRLWRGERKSLVRFRCEDIARLLADPKAAAGAGHPLLNPHPKGR